MFLKSNVYICQKKSIMKYAFILLITVIVASCGVKVPYDNNLRDEFNLNSTDKIKKVQFFTSATIIMEKNKEFGNQQTGDDGALVTNSSKQQDRVIIPINTKCVFDNFGPNGELIVRFEVGVGKTISFAMRQNQSSTKYYLIADWTTEKGGKLTYGNESFYATSISGNAYLMVKRKNLQKTKRKDRVVKGMKV